MAWTWRFAVACGGVLAVVSSGCATRYESTRLGAVTVHTVTHAQANVHVVVEGDAAFAVDSGLTGEAPELERDLEALGLSPARLSAIVLTHGHYDHAGGARYFQKKYKTPIVAGRGDLPMMARGTNDPICPVGFLARSRHAYDAAQTFEPVVPDIVVDRPTSLLALTRVHAVVVPVPSHTEGSLAVVAGEAALVGDLFRGGIDGTGAAVHFYMCDVDANRAAIARFVGTTARGATTFFPGHFGPVGRGDVLADLLGE